MERFFWLRLERPELSVINLKDGRISNPNPDTTGFSRVVFNFNLRPRDANPDTTGFSRVVLQLQPRVRATRTPDTTGFSRVVLQLQPTSRLRVTDTTGFSRVVLQFQPMVCRGGVAS